MKRKVIIALSVNVYDRKVRQKVLASIATRPGVESIALRGIEKRRLEVVGEGLGPLEDVVASLMKNNRPLSLRICQCIFGQLQE
ncbi:hypothetical protein RND71_032149 [Anisodus tanguticus]|uniref:Uncharacterized protein n=1 Tax=Anisodus tanguticus TaxID=243964 RepID=A0AAE1RC36_9SOLA|nr:hypothetical protein RND71_032149 [Anisodus tanguticus]